MDYLIDFPDIEVEPPTRKWMATENHYIDWDVLIGEVLRLDLELFYKHKTNHVDVRTLTLCD